MSTEADIVERLRTGEERSCPFEANSHTLQAHDPCPVCGDLGTDEALDKPIHCVDLNNRLLMKEALAEIAKLRAERDPAAREEAWIVTQSGLAVSMWLTELAATKVLDSYKRSTKGKGNWAVERVTVIRALPSTVIATQREGDAT